MTYRILAADIDDPIATADTAEAAIDALLVEALFSVAYATKEHPLCWHEEGECLVESDADYVADLHRPDMVAGLTADGRVVLYLASYESGFTATLTAERA
jgi:hypothetical protein